MCDISDVNWLGESILHQEYDELYMFFQEVWAEAHAYVVMMARRCFNLNHIFLQVHAASGKRAANEGRIISNTALLLYADEIADYYISRGRFPSVLLVDDLAYHGRAIVKLLYDLEELVASKLEERLGGRLDEDRRHYLHWDMVEAIDIAVFARNSQPLLIEADYLHKLWEKKLVRSSGLKRFSQQISSFLQKVDVPNTSYTVSFSVREEEAARGADSWADRKWKFRGVEEQFYACWVGNNFLPTVRYRRKYIPELENPEVWMTGMTLFGGVEPALLDRLAREVLAELDACGVTAQTTVSILSRQHRLLQKPRAQFFVFLLSILCFWDFCTDSGVIQFDLGESDLGKITRNFARGEELAKEIIAMDEIPGLWGRLQNILYPAFCAGAEPLLEWLEEDPLPDELRGRVNDAVAFTMEQVGIDSEAQAYRAVCGTGSFDLGRQRVGVIDLKDYFGSISAPGLDLIACTFTQVDCGVMALNESELEERAGRIRPLLKAGELATFATPRVYHLFIPALAMVEQEHWRLGLDAQDAVKLFIEFLPNTVDPGAGGMTDALNREEQELQKLKRDGVAFVDRLYECGHSLNDWDFELMTADDWREEGDGSYLAFVRREAARQDVYTEMAQKFLECPR